VAFAIGGLLLLSRRSPRRDSRRTHIEAGFSRRERDSADPARVSAPPIGAQAIGGTQFFDYPPVACTLIDLPARSALPTEIIFNGQSVSEAVLGTFDIVAMSPDTELIPNRLLEAMDANRGCSG